jgi:hypothetical protein
MWVAGLDDIDHEICEIARLAAEQLAKNKNCQCSKKSLSSPAPHSSITGKNKMLQFIIGYDTHSNLYTVEDTNTGEIRTYPTAEEALAFVNKKKAEAENGRPHKS